MNNRLKSLIWLVLILFLIVFIRVFYISIIKYSYYKNELDNNIYGVIEGGSAKRGKIYDRNHKLLVDNVGIKSIFYKRVPGVNEIDVSLELSNFLELNYELVNNDMLKDLWLVINDSSNKITSEEYDKLKRRELSNYDIELLKRERISNDELDSINKKQAYVYYLMHNGYSYEEKLIKKGVTDKEYAYIKEGKIKGVTGKLIWDRKYLYGDTLRGIFGSVSSSGIPLDLKDHYIKKGYKLTDRVGISGLELEYDEYLRGKPAKYKKVGNNLELISKEIPGNDLVLSIDIDLQLEAEKIIEKEMLKAKKEPNTNYFNRVFTIISNPNTGEILSMIGKFINNNKVYDYSSYIINSSITVGSVIKGASISVGYKEGVIDIGSVLKDECIKISNTPVKCSWNRSGFGNINDINALRLSSNVYQFKTAMKVAGSNYYYNMPFSINNDAFKKYREMFNSYGLGVKTGIDLPNESIGLKGSNDTPGLLLDFSIGQYDIYTPLQLTQYINTIANGGERLKLYLLKEVYNNNELLLSNDKYLLNKIDLDSKYLNRIKDGFKAVLGYNGTGYGYIDLKFNPAGKTGTSQSFYDSDKDGIIDKQTITSTFAGFAPFNNPKMSIVVVTPDVSHIYGNTYMSMINRRISNEITKKYFEIYK